MAIETFEELFMHLARDAYQAEKQHTKALPKMARKAAHPELRQVLERHLEETQGQIGRLEEIFRIMSVKGKGKRCEAAEGLIGEAQSLMGEIADELVLDAGIIAAAQALEHYEIARYGTLVAWAGKMGKRDVVRLLQQTLREEHDANQQLNKIAEQTINAEAMKADGGEQPKASRGAKNEPGAGGPRSRQQPRERSRSQRQQGKPAVRQGGRLTGGPREQASSRRRGAGDAELKKREYRDASGRIRHHTKANMRQHGR